MMKVVLNEVMVSKLESISFDIKYYLNANIGLSLSLEEEDVYTIKYMDKEDVDELMEIRKRTKQLARKLKNKYYSNVEVKW